MLGHCVKQHLEVVVVEQGLVAAVGVAVVVVVDLEPLHRQLMLCAHQSHKHSMLADPDSCLDAGQLCCSSTLDTRMHTLSHLSPTHKQAAQPSWFWGSPSQPSSKAHRCYPLWWLPSRPVCNVKRPPLA